MAEVQREDDLIRLLSSQMTRDFLIRNDGAEVSLEDVCGKTVGLLFVSSFGNNSAYDFTRVLERVYKELSRENFEIVLIWSGEVRWFSLIFSAMPWLSIYPDDAEAVNRLHRTFQVMQHPYLVFIDGDGNVSENDWVSIVQEYESEAYPFTAERVIQLQEEDRVGKENFTIRRLLDDYSTYLISKEAKKVSVDVLEGKTVGLFVVAGRIISFSNLEKYFIKKLVSLYDELTKEESESFEIVTIYGEENRKDSSGLLEILPWLQLPFNGKIFRKLVRYYYKPSAFPMLVIFGSNGKPVQPDHDVFTPEKLRDLERTVMASIGRDLSSSLYRIRMTPNDRDTREDQKIHFRMILIAMKGGPCSGKYKIADAISDSLRCTVIRFDEILDMYRPHGNTSFIEKRSALYNLAFGTACDLALDQLLLKRPVVIDSPLACRSHLHRFTQLASAAEYNMVVVVECKPQDDYEQKLWFQKRGRKYWDELADQSDLFTAGVEENNHLPVALSWLNVDTTSGTLRPDFAGSAIRDLTYCGKAHSAELTNWSPLKPIHEALLEERGWQKPGFDAHRDKYHYDRGGKHDLAIKHRVPQEGQKTELPCCSYGHYMANFREKGLTYKTKCRACQSQISEGAPAYTCVHCRTALHKSCAEWDREKAMITSKELPSYLRIKSASYWFRDLQICEVCTLQPANKRRPKFACESCLFETHFKAGIVPTIVRHECHTKLIKKEGHFLTFWVTSTTHNGKYECSACALPGKFVGYVCNIWPNNYFHVECALMPRPGINVHGGYRHPMVILSEWEDESDEYICRECWKPRKPGCWFYYCEDCDYPVHTYCLKFTEGS